jgi:NTP pyrophosphatase (non-canonical NTP hydrolase)
MKLPKYLKAIIEIEYARAKEKYGAKFETLQTGILALLAEFKELNEAIVRGDIDGKHGVHREAAQVAAVCIKIIDSARIGDEKNV